MNTYAKSLITALLISAPLIVSAADDPAPEKAPAAPAQASGHSMPMHAQGMNDQIRKMQAAHDKIAAATTPAERQLAMQEGMAVMSEGMAMMRMNCQGMGMGGKGDAGMGMMDMMMKMMNQQSHMMKMPMGQ